MQIEAKLEELGLALPEPARVPPGLVLPFSWVRARGDRAYLSGHVPLNPDGSIAGPFGKVGAELSEEEGYGAARLTALAMLADRGRLGRMLGAAVPDDAFDFPGAMTIKAVRSMHEHLKADPDDLGWWTHLFVHAGDGVLIGPGGYKGRAGEEGAVQIGYAIVPAYRGRGPATEAARGLVGHAFAHEHVERVVARTLAERNASVRVPEKAGMRFAGAVPDPDLGETWRWSLERADYRPGRPPPANPDGYGRTDLAENPAGDFAPTGSRSKGSGAGG